MTFRNQFQDHVSSSAFQNIDGELRLVGKFGQVSLLNDTFDIWITANPPLTSRKLNTILKRAPEKLGFTLLSGETYTQTKSKELVLKTLPLLGVRKRRVDSLKTMQRLSEQLRGAA